MPWPGRCATRSPPKSAKSETLGHGTGRSRLAEAEARIAQSKTRAMARVGEIAADTAAAIVARLIGKEVSKDEVQRALVQRAAE